MNISAFGSRPLILAIGPTAAAQVRIDHSDFELVDVAVVDGEPGHLLYEKIDTLLYLFSQRSVVVCLFDARDESWCRMASRIARLAGKLVSLPLLFVLSDPRPRLPDRCAMLSRLAQHLGACVIEAPQEPGGLLRAGMLSIIGLVRAGFTGFDPADFATITKAPSVGYVAFAVDAELAADGDGWARIAALVKEPHLLHVMLAIRCGRDTTLHTINAICSRLLNVEPHVNVMIATPMTGSGEALELGVVAIQSIAKGEG
jgi:hypothetical protein